MITPRESIRTLLLDLCSDDLPAEGVGPFLARLRHAFLTFGSRTEDNLRAMEAVDLVMRRKHRALGIRGADLALADLVNAMEDLPMPDEIRAQFPKLDQAGWESALRLVTLVLLAFTPEN